MIDKIFISGNVPSLKNSKIPMGGFMLPSKTVTKYLKSHGIKSFRVSERKDKPRGVVHYVKSIPTFKNEIDKLKEFIDNNSPPYKINFHFVRNSRHKWDFHNACQLPLDLMSAYGLIEDDNMDIVHPGILYIDEQGCSYDKDNPGVYIQIEK